MRLDLAAIELIGGVLLAPSCGRAVIDGARLVVDGSPDGGPAGGVLHLGAADEQVLLAAVEVVLPDLHKHTRKCDCSSGPYPARRQPPLQSDDPRPLGGLARHLTDGIEIVKSMASDIRYARVLNMNQTIIAVGHR